MLQLLRWSTEMNIDEAYSVIFDPEFDPNATDTGNPVVGRILMLGETIGAMVKHGVLNRDLVLDIFWADGIWKLVGPSALKVRESAGDARLYENFEALVTS
jgi:hypothetical protein